MIEGLQDVINIRGRILDFSDPQIMGIINVTPDSFYTKSRYNDIGEILNQTGQMLSEGASIIDVGAMSSRPGAVEITVEEEQKRLIPAISGIKNKYPDAVISVDTYRSEVLLSAHEAGADIVNDISGGGLDATLFETVAELQMPYILMHMKGTPRDMQNDPQSEDIVMEVLTWLCNRLFKLRSLGINDVIIDPGFGFGKSAQDNYQLLRALESFQILDAPLMVGLSRKSMIYKPLGITAEEALTGTIGAHMISLLAGVKLLRVHDVKAAFQTIQIFKEYQG